MANDASQPKISLGLGGARKARLPINGTKRPHSALDHGGDAGDSRQSSAVSHFDHKAGGAIDEKRPKNHAPLVITSQKNRDWKEASKRRKQRGQLPEESMDANAQIAAIEEAERRERDRTFGLNIMRPDDQNVASTEEDADAVPAPVGESTTTRERTADERAMDALLGNQEQSTLVVAAVSETDAFQDDFRSAPDVATLDDYARVPVEEFGAAMLRGMGWKDGEGVGIRKNTKQKQTESLLRRPALLGIGAKADAAVDAELGGWGKAARGKEIKIYNPVLLKDKKTGELFTEEEAQQKREDAQRLAFEEEFEQREREKRRKARRERDRESDRRHERRHSRDRTSTRHDDDRRRSDKPRHREHDEDRHSSHRARHDKDDRRRDSRSHRDERSERDHKHERRHRDDDRRRDRSRERGHRHH